MALNFPNNPSTAAIYSSPDGSRWQWDNRKWVTIGPASGSGAFLPLAGGTMLGPIILSGPPSNDLEPTTKVYVDNGFLKLTGGTLSGRLSITFPDDAGRQAFIGGTTKGVRFVTKTTGTFLEGVDSPGAASYQDLYLGGSSVVFQVAGNTAGYFDSAGNLILNNVLRVLSSADPGQSTTSAMFSGSRWRFRVNAGDEPSAGTIDYRGFDAGAVGIVGAGVGTNRTVHVWDFLWVDKGIHFPSFKPDGVYHNYQFGWDGGHVQVSVDGGGAVYQLASLTEVNNCLLKTGDTASGRISFTANDVAAAYITGNGGLFVDGARGTSLYNHVWIYGSDPVSMSGNDNCRIYALVNGQRQWSYGASGTSWTVCDESGSTWGVLWCGPDHWTHVMGLDAGSGTIKTTGAMQTGSLGIYGGTFYNYANNGWLYFDGSLRVWDFQSANNANAAGNLYAGGSVFIGGCQLYNSGGNLRVVQAFVTNSNLSADGGVIYLNGMYIQNIAGYLYTPWTFRSDGDFLCNSVYRRYAARGARLECWTTDWDWMSIGLSGGNILFTPDFGSGFYVTPAPFSDVRLKADICDSEIDALAAILTTPVRAFKWNKEGIRLQPHIVDPEVSIGFVAQEIAETMPSAVELSPFDGDTLHIRDHNITPYLVRSIQQLEEMVQKLTARITQLEATA